MASRWEGSGQRSDGGVSTFRRRGVIPVWTVLVAVLFMQLNVPAAAQEAGAVSATVSSDNPTLGSAHASPQSDNGTGSVDPATPKEAKAEKKDKDDDRAAVLRGSVVVAPLPISSPAIGTGVIPVVGYIFHLSDRDEKSPPSTVVAAGILTNNGTRGFALGGQVYFDENRYKVTSGYVHGNVDYDLYGPGVLTDQLTKLPLKQTGQVFLGEFLRHLWWDFFLGPRFFNGASVLTVRKTSSSSAEVPPDLGLHTSLRSVGLRLQRDTRPNHFYPTTGSFTDFTADFFSQGIGSKYTFQAYTLMYNKYQRLGKNQVLALGSLFCGTGGQPPFYGNCIYGSRSWLRGYTAGRYFDRYMMASQVEYRLALPWRLGLVGFGGVGGVIAGSEQYLVRKNYFLPAGGGGLRVDLSKKYHVNLRADMGWGRDGRTFGMGVGEAF